MMETILNLGLNDKSVEGLPTLRATTGSRSMPIAALCKCIRAL